MKSVNNPKLTLELISWMCARVVGQRAPFQVDFKFERSGEETSPGASLEPEIQGIKFVTEVPFPVHLIYNLARWHYIPGPHSSHQGRWSRTVKTPCRRRVMARVTTPARGREVKGHLHRTFCGCLPLWPFPWSQRTAALHLAV